MTLSTKQFNVLKIIWFMMTFVLAYMMFALPKELIIVLRLPYLIQHSSSSPVSLSN